MHVSLTRYGSRHKRRQRQKSGFSRFALEWFEM